MGIKMVLEDTLVLMSGGGDHGSPGRSPYPGLKVENYEKTMLFGGIYHLAIGILSIEKRTPRTQAIPVWSHQSWCRLLPIIFNRKRGSVVTRMGMVRNGANEWDKVRASSSTLSWLLITS
ncbi:hypothetical protein OPV22_012271 [Ensete ventricosum]|uniref:Uncharacterized protein n=1 Tax=Ensete ventricosum TaxID=4639 RepID=A0AAV8R2S2_ENSVE|nr:hypothetical protein OPV22_012271 [Ensete ventricosum]